MKLIYNYYSKHGINALVYIYFKFFLRSEKKRKKWLCMAGMKIGEGTILGSSVSVFPEPFMIELGNKVYLAAGVKFLTHDGALSWCSRAMHVTDKRTEKIGRIEVGDNCFIGADATIMMGVTIGKNCIIGANSVVTKDVPDGSVVAGNPAKFICDIETYFNKNKSIKDYTCGFSYADKRKYYEEKGVANSFEEQ